MWCDLYTDKQHKCCQNHCCYQVQCPKAQRPSQKVGSVNKATLFIFCLCYLLSGEFNLLCHFLSSIATRSSLRKSNCGFVSRGQNTYYQNQNLSKQLGKYSGSTLRKLCGNPLGFGAPNQVPIKPLAVDLILMINLNQNYFTYNNAI